MKRISLLIGAISMVSAANAQFLYSNQTDTNASIAQLNAVGVASNAVAAPAGGSWSEVQTNGTLTNGTAGFGTATTFRLADDFTFTGNPWDVTGFSVFGYQTGSTGNPFSGGTLNLWNGDPSLTTSSIITTGVWTGATDSINTSAGNKNVFRIFNGTASANTITRRVWESSFALTTTLTAGTYWIDYSLITVNGGGAFGPATTHAGALGVSGANAKQFNGTTWAGINDTGSLGTGSTPQEMPFLVKGTVQGVPEPSTLAVLGLGALIALRKRSVKKS